MLKLDNLGNSEQPVMLTENNNPCILMMHRSFFMLIANELAGGICTTTMFYHYALLKVCFITLRCAFYWLILCLH